MHSKGGKWQKIYDLSNGIGDQLASNIFVLIKFYKEARTLYIIDKRKGKSAKGKMLTLFKNVASFLSILSIY